MVDFSFGSLSSDDDIADIEKFFANKDCKVFERNYQQSLERVRTNAAWVKHDSKDIEDWLKANGFLEWFVFIDNCVIYINNYYQLCNYRNVVWIV